ncbi:MAG: GNAT family N-acetyltransferase [Proteobacteria bacterium]|nr:MAG: GNAT family N-acetyltransferase [Pseudomonadota bacterium]
MNQNPALDVSISDDELRRALEDNEAECFSTFRAMGEEVEITNLETATLIATGVKFWLFNGVFRVRVSEDLISEALDQWIQHFKTRALPFAIFTYAHSQSQPLGEALLKSGFKVSESTSVVFDIKNLQSFMAPPLAPEFRKLEIRSAGEFKAFSECWSKVFEVPSLIQEAFNRWSTCYGFEKSLPLQNIAIMHGDRAVAIATYFSDSKVAGIYSIGVDPEFRRRGLGLQIAANIAEKAQARGVRYLVGNGSEEGMHVYRKAGVRVIGVAQRWIFD